MSTLTNTHNIIAVNDSLSIPQMQQVLEQGAKGYLAINSPAEQYHAAANAVTLGALWIPPALVLHLSKVLTQTFSQQPDTASGNAKGSLKSLTERERQVAELAAKGVSNKHIGQHLHIAERTVKQHLTNVFAKLGVKDRLQLVLFLR
ncbi:response regulator transcription factor [Arsukibacterium sp.]|uniref:response regulator transcription factor n=1 Tax=Arsukibacterium sp. TaxID=1977258 RepID=UPI002FD87E9E